MSELNETKKIKVVGLYELTPKQFEPDLNPQNSLFFTKKAKKKLPVRAPKIKK